MNKLYIFRQKHPILFAIFGFLFLYCTLQVQTQRSAGVNGVCSGCHGGATAAGGSLSLTGVPTSYVNGQTYNLTLTLTDPTKLAGGFNVLASGGNLTPGADQKLIGATLTHDKRRNFVSNTATWNFTWTAPPSGNPAIDFTYRANAVNNNGNTGGDNGGYMGQITNVTLPLDIVSFETNQTEKNYIRLDWEIENVVNVSGFEIQRSTDGKSFSPINFVPISRADNYTYIDKDASEGNNYYRLKVLDYDGSFFYSDIKSEHLTKIRSVFKVYPNPVSLHGTINIEHNETDLKYELTSILGNIVSAEKLDQDGIRLNDINLDAGVYIIGIRSSVSDELLYSTQVVIR